MPKFKLLAGKHQDENGTSYKAGDTIECEQPLDEMFANKFKRMGGPTKTQRDHDDLFDKGGGTKVMDSKDALARKVAKANAAKPGPGQDEEEFIDLSREAAKAKGKKAKPSEDEEDSEVESEEEETPAEDAEDETNEVAAEGDESEGESEEEEEKPAPKPKKVAKAGKMPSKKRNK